MIPQIYTHGRVIPADVVAFRPAVYGILIDEYQQIFLVRHHETGFWFPPGAILQPHETLKQAVCYHFRQATGITPEVGQLLLVEERHMCNGTGQNLQVMAFYYVLRRSVMTAVTRNEANETAVEGRWFPLTELKRTDLQFGYDAIHLAQRMLDNPPGR